MLKSLALKLLFISLMAFLGSCSSFEQIKAGKADAFQLGMVLTSFTKDSSQLLLLDKNWTIVKRISLPYGGLAQGKEYGGHYYIPVSGIPMSSKDNIIIDFNLSNETVSHIKTLEHPMDSAVLKRSLYVIHNTEINGGFLTRIDLGTKKITGKIKLAGVLKRITSLNGKILIVSDDVKGMKQHVYEVSSDLKIVKHARNPYTAFPNKIFKKGKNAFIINNAKSNFSGPANLVVQFCQGTNSFKPLELKMTAPWEMFKNERAFYVTSYDFANEKGNFIYKTNLQFTKMNRFTLDNAPIISDLNGSEFYSTDGKGLYQYRLPGFSLKKKKMISTEDRRIIGLFFR